MKKIVAIASIILSVLAATIQVNAQGKSSMLTYYKSSNPNIELKIENTNAKYVKYLLKDAKGNILENGKVPVNKPFEISIKELPAGIYNLQIAGSDNLFEVK